MYVCDNSISSDHAEFGYSSEQMGPNAPQGALAKVLQQFETSFLDNNNATSSSLEKIVEVDNVKNRGLLYVWAANELKLQEKTSSCQGNHRQRC